MNKKTILNIMVSILLIAFLIYKINIHTISQSFIGVNYVILIVAMPLVALLFIIRTAKWTALMDALRIRTSFWNNFRVVLIGAFYGIFTPGKFGELARTMYMKSRKGAVFATVVFERLSDVIVLIILCIATILFYFHNSMLFLVTTGLVVLVLVSTLLLLNKRVIMVAGKFFGIDKKYQHEYLNASLSIMKNKGLLVKVFLISFVYYFVNWVFSYIVIKAISTKINGWLVLTLPLIVLLANIPITISGLGMRELVTVYAFGLMNTPASYGFSFSILLFVTLMLIPAIIGFVLTILDHSGKACQKPPVTRPVA